MDIKIEQWNLIQGISHKIGFTLYGHCGSTELTDGLEHQLLTIHTMVGEAGMCCGVYILIYHTLSVFLQNTFVML